MTYRELLSKKAQIDLALTNIEKTLEYLELDPRDMGLVLSNFETYSKDLYRDEDGTLYKSNVGLRNHLDKNYNTVPDYTTWKGRYIGLEFKGVMCSEMCAELKSYAESKKPQLVFNGILYDSCVESGYHSADCNNLEYYLYFYLLENKNREVMEGRIRKKKVRKENDDLTNLIFFHDMEVEM